MELGKNRKKELSYGRRKKCIVSRDDEATASLDSESEAKIQEALMNTSLNKTTFVIAHRLSTVLQADQILVLEDGNITGVGTHEELMENHAYYPKIVQQQFAVE
ncbi:ABC transporter ATP-binding protein [Bacillus sp. 71mf]|uniref:ABC transporter ATP-binding protein n=1 Tax=Bacillus sp. 71mf TaxID=1761757 RepID=UPI0008E043C1|nr:ABC transporter ATP-binding protein [Bacillus sp. 71mf]SFJ47740.1 ATP-binding cassette, subfamily B, AbcA/BmrA [Bacillus sp. 71mf]SFT18357.1 ATP-binding cassette, subfamily B, AbcA/BmrA [Bacillus sp. 103mf]